MMSLTELLMYSGVKMAKRRGQYPVDILIRASDRAGLLRDDGDTFANEAVNVTLNE